MIRVNRIEDKFPGNNDFLESIEYSPEVPYFILRKQVPFTEVVPIHYADTVEILLLKNIRGTVSVGQRSVEVEQDAVVLIPPNVVHSTSFRQGGEKICLEVSPVALRHYLDLEHLLQVCGSSFYHLETIYYCYGQARRLLDLLIRNDGDFPVCIHAILSFFQLLLRHSQRKNNYADFDFNQNARLQKLINWSRANLERKIELDEAAAVMGFSKSYFCKFFKKATGMSYVSFLQHLRVSRAELLLHQGVSVSECCYACGYDNISYFIQLFHRYTGQTMLQYQQKYFHQ